MKPSSLVLALAAVLALGGSLSAAEGDAGHPNAKTTDAAKVERATVTGTVTEVNAEKKSFVLKDEAGKTEPYRAFFAGGNVEEILAKIAKVKVGDHLQVVYTVREGRRVLSITEAK